MNILSLIKEIEQNKLEPEKLIQCLDIPQNFVLSNAIKQIVKLKLDGNEVVDKLSKLSVLTQKENQLIGIYTVGHLALAALKKMDSSIAKEKYKELVSKINEWDKDCVEKLIENNAFDL